MVPSRVKVEVVLIALALGLCLLHGFNSKNGFLTVYANGFNPDSYGDYLDWIEISQWNGTEYTNILTVNWYEYNNATGFSYVANPGQKVLFVAVVMLNETLASTLNEAGNRTAVGLWVTDVYVDTLMPCYSKSGPAGGYYQITFEQVWDAGPSGDEYEIQFEYYVKR